MSHVSLPQTAATGIGYYWHEFRAWAHHKRLVWKYLTLRNSKVFVCFNDGRRDSTVLKGPRVENRTWVIAARNGGEVRVDSSLIDDIGDKGVYGY